MAPPSSSYPVDQSKRPLPNEVKNRNCNVGSRLKSWVRDHFIKVEELEEDDIELESTRRSSKTKGLPTDVDWEYVRNLLPFLKIFYDTTVKLSDSYNVTRNEYMKEIYRIGTILDKIYESEDSGTISIASKMKRKHDKYCGNIDKINIFLFIAVVFDQRFKLNYVNWVIEHSYDVNKAVLLKSKVQVVLSSLFETYGAHLSCPKQMKFRDMKSIALSTLKNEELKLKSEYSSIRICAMDAEARKKAFRAKLAQKGEKRIDSPLVR
ncbi:hAT-like transposase, RNase-H fold [Dillenia turbinata]|uniref:HAT-like transposase, RNase-H fold n=1 Tax=Dillenia turbinata TaxID=194707 RepID=A0AAN8WEE7_9MAGN